MLDLLRIVAGLVLVFFLPGAALVYALFPRRGELDLEYDTLYRLFISVGLSVVVTILVGFVLNMLGVKEDGTGFFTSSNIIISLLSITIIGLLVAWYRGAFPVLGKVSEKLYREPARGKYDMGGGPPFINKEESSEIASLSKRRSTLNRRLSMLERRPESDALKEERRVVLDELQEVVSKLEELENRRRGV
ncbi:MAG TPA: DUF1616 domain-containing protein [Euryarchaeota archaeon]|nr:DUF1616 domain-containing protein [Euryarchaeota archaeon]